MQYHDESLQLRRILQDEEEIETFETFYDYKQAYERNYGYDSEFQKYNVFKKNLEFIETF